MRRFNFLAIIAILLVAIVFPGCSDTEVAKIGYSLGPKHSRWQRDKDFISNKVQNLGGKILIEEADGDAEKQIKQAKELIDAGIHVLIITPENSETSAEIIDYAKEKGVYTIAYDRLVKNGDLDYYISFDNVKVGELQAEYLTKSRPKGNYVILGGDPKDNNSLLLNLGQMNVLQPLVDNGDIKIVLDTYVEEWDEKEAYRIMDELLKTTTDIDAVIASNDHLASGVFRALKDNKIEKHILISGQDAELNACKRIVKGEQTMTVYKMLESLASSAAKTAVELATTGEQINTQLTVNNGKKMVPAILLPSMYIVHRDNIRMTVIAEGYLDEDEIFED